LEFPPGVERQQAQVDPVIVGRPFEGEAAQQRLSLEMVDGEVGDDVFASSPLPLAWFASWRRCRSFPGGAFAGHDSCPRSFGVIRSTACDAAPYV
jgi:hypothetical protein